MTEVPPTVVLEGRFSGDVGEPVPLSVGAEGDVQAIDVSVDFDSSGKMAFRTDAFHRDRGVPFFGLITRRAVLAALIESGAKISPGLEGAVQWARARYCAGEIPPPAPGLEVDQFGDLEELRWVVGEERMRLGLLGRHDRVCQDIFGYRYEAEGGVHIPTIEVCYRKLLEHYRANRIDHFVPVYVYQPAADAPFVWFPIEEGFRPPDDARTENLPPKVLWRLLSDDMFPAGSRGVQVSKVPTSIHEDAHHTAGVDYPNYNTLLKAYAVERVGELKSPVHGVDEFGRKIASIQGARAFTFLEHCAFIPATHRARVREACGVSAEADIHAVDFDTFYQEALETPQEELRRQAKRLVALGDEVLIPLGGLAREGYPGGGGPWTMVRRWAAESSAHWKLIESVCNLRASLLLHAEITPERWYEECRVLELREDSLLRLLYRHACWGYGLEEERDYAFAFLGPADRT